MSLQANSTFLPLLDDLLSPDFRPVLQTPTGVIQYLPPYDPAGVVKANAAAKIQNWWRVKAQAVANGRRSSAPDLRALSVQHSVRHQRTEEHVMHLESEVARLKSALASERRMRSLQLEAIRSLWSQVQKISDSSSLMTRSMPNGLPPEYVSPRKKPPSVGGGNGMSVSFCATTTTSREREPELEPATTTSTSSAAHCCSHELENLREMFQKEIGDLRTMISALNSSNTGGSDKDKTSNTTITSTSCTSTIEEDEHEPGSTGEGGATAAAAPAGPQRPMTLNLTQPPPSAPAPTGVTVEVEDGQILGYAADMANKLIEEGVTK